MPEAILPEGLGQRVEPLLSKPKLKCRRIPFAGRKPTEPRRVMAGILFVLKTGIPWKLLPATSDFPSGHTCRRKLVEWHRAGVWQKLLQNVLNELQQKRRLDWRRAIADSSSVRASHGGEKTGPNPTDRRKLGSKHHLLTEAHGIPLSFTLIGANRHDVTQLLALVERIPPVQGQRGRPRRRPDRVQGDRGYDSEPHRQALNKRA
jgi:transposase